jgi:hypothetical protein
MKKTGRVLFESMLRGKHQMATVAAKGAAEPIKVTTGVTAAPGKTNEWLAEELVTSYVCTAFMRNFLTQAEQHNITITGYECDAIGDAVTENKIPAIVHIDVYPKIYVENTKALERTKKLINSCIKSNPAEKMFPGGITYHPVIGVNTAVKEPGSNKREIFF